MTEIKAAAVREWLELLYGNAPGYLHICSTGAWSGRIFAPADLDQAVDYIARLDAASKAGIYCRTTTLASQPERRGEASDSLALPGLWADLDIAGPGHAATSLPPTENAARSIITATGLPEPTAWVHSGGGLYPWWLLDIPYVITDDLGDVEDLSAGWQRIIEHASQQLGWKYGNVKDLARVLRIPGTVNRKAPDNPRPCRILSADGPRYQLEDLYAAMFNGLAAIVEPELEPRPTPPKPHPAAPRPDGETRPGEDFNVRVDWAEVVAMAGGTIVGPRGCGQNITDVRRPGKDSGISATINARGTDRLHIFTDAWPPLEMNQSYDKFGVYAAVHHRGDISAAAADLASRGYGTPLAQSLERETLAWLAQQAEPVATEIPIQIRDLLAVSVKGDRYSARFYRLACELHAAGVPGGQAITVLAEWAGRHAQHYRCDPARDLARVWNRLGAAA